jgi:hypothetical protein
MSFLSTIQTNKFVGSAVNYSKKNQGKDSKSDRKKGKFWRGLGAGISSIFGGAVDGFGQKIQDIKLPEVETRVKADNSIFMVIGFALLGLFLIFKKK